MPRARPLLWLVGLLLVLAALPARAQTFEIAPFGGYRFGGDLYEVYAGRSLDTDGAPSFGVTLDLFVDRGTSVTFLYSRQQTRIGPDRWQPDAASVELSVDHYHVGGTRELDGGTVRPFLAGSLGLTRFGSAHDSEVRFSAAGGGGVKVMPSSSSHLGVRLEGRAYAVFVDGRLGTTICGAGGCIVGLDVFVVWQVEFTAAVVVSF